MEQQRSLDHLAGELRWASHVLNDCATLARDLDFNKHENVRRIGKALSEIIDIELEIYKVRPDLETRNVKAEWNQPPVKRMQVAIRPATAADEAAVLVLLEELFVPPGVRPEGYTEDRARTGLSWAIEGAGADVLLAFEGERLVGLASVYADIQSIRYGKRCWLQDLVVTSEYRGRKVGRQLLVAATEWARERGCTHLELASGAGRVDAHRFYRREEMSQSYNFQLWIGK
jgi:GNAT superfamily N-acetyltransferase